MHAHCFHCLVVVCYKHQSCSIINTTPYIPTYLHTCIATYNTSTTWHYPPHFRPTPRRTHHLSHGDPELPLIDAQQGDINDQDDIDSVSEGSEAACGGAAVVVYERMDWEEEEGEKQVGEGDGEEQVGESFHVPGDEQGGVQGGVRESHVRGCVNRDQGGVGNRRAGRTSGQHTEHQGQHHVPPHQQEKRGAQVNFKGFQKAQGQPVDGEVEYIALKVVAEGMGRGKQGDTIIWCVMWCNVGICALCVCY